MEDPSHQPRLLEAEQLGALLETLRGDGYQLLGPRLRDGAVVYEAIEGVRDLPVGWTERQEAGTYRLERRGDPRIFGFSVGPQSWKPAFFVPEVSLWKARRGPEGLRIEARRPAPVRRALIGARSCDLHAIAMQDRIFLEGAYPDPDYQARRAEVFVVAVQCAQAGGTCFCVSMGTGPRATAGFDLALTELLDEGGHRFLVEVGSARGRALLERLPHRLADRAELTAADELIAGTVAGMGRRLDTADLQGLLRRNLEHPRWDQVAERCLSCTNCTLVCPTCFCATVEDLTDLQTQEAERIRRWDSCFTEGHSLLHGGAVRASIRSRYRQWLTHKVGTWIDQFGSSGCVGCGRCITWCPVGIDLTEELAAIRAQDGAERAQGTPAEPSA